MKALSAFIFAMMYVLGALPLDGSITGKNLVGAITFAAVGYLFGKVAIGVAEFVRA